MKGAKIVSIKNEVAIPKVVSPTKTFLPILSVIKPPGVVMAILTSDDNEDTKPIIVTNPPSAKI